MTLQEALEHIRPIDPAGTKQALAKWNAVAKPLGSLGLLEDAVTQISAMTGSLHPKLEKRCVVMFCADNGVVAQGVTQTGSEVTAIVAGNVCTHDTSVCKMAEVAHADVFPVDMGMRTRVDNPLIWDCRIAAGTQDMSQGPAMTREQAVRGIEAGIDVASRLADRGYGLLATGEMGIGNTTTSSAMGSVLLGRPVSEMTGPGAGLSKAGVLHKIAVIEQAIARNRPDPADPIDVLSKVGGFDIAGMAGLCIGAAVRRIPCLIDGFISAISALCAVRLCPAVSDYLIASHVSAEPAGQLLLDALGKRPMITAGMRLGEGTGAVAAMPLIDMALAVFNEMATFDDIQVEAYVPL